MLFKCIGYITLNGRMVKYDDAKDVKGIDFELFKVLSQHLPA
jgi:hypothetical protein